MALMASLALSACGGSGGDNADNSEVFKLKGRDFVFNNKHDSGIALSLLQFVRTNGLDAEHYEVFYPDDGGENAGKKIVDANLKVGDLDSRIVNFSSSTGKGIPFKTKSGAAKEGFGRLEIYSNGIHAVTVVKLDGTPLDANDKDAAFYIESPVSTYASDVYKEMSSKDIYDAAKHSGNKLRYEGKAFIFNVATYETHAGDMRFDFDVNKKDGDDYEITAEGSAKFQMGVNPLMFDSKIVGKKRGNFFAINKLTGSRIGMEKIEFHKTSKTFSGNDPLWMEITDIDIDGMKMKNMKAKVHMDGPGAKSMYGDVTYDNKGHDLTWMGLLGNKK